MNIKQLFLTPNEWSRPQKKLREVKAIVIHWTANPRATAIQNRDYFEARKAGTSSYGSAHYIIDKTGDIIQCIPNNEIAYHTGTSRKDPASNKVYTDEARARFGAYATEKSSPNLCTLSIELCPIDEEGNFTQETLKACAELSADLCKKYNLTTKDITTHHNIVGWKDCPRLWTNYPLLFERFLKKVDTLLDEE